MNDPLTVGGVVAAVVVPLVTFLVWLGRWFTEKHVTKLLADAREDSKEMQRIFREELKEFRTMLVEMNNKWSNEIRRLSEVLEKHDDILESCLLQLKKEKE
jgi:hypothetical protein